MSHSPLVMLTKSVHHLLHCQSLGEVFVLLYFGYAATLVLPYLLYCQGTTDIPWGECFVYATAVGLLATNIIIVNNLRDRLTDVLVDKRTTSVRWGRKFSVWEYVFCLSMAMVEVVVAYVLYASSVVRLLPLLILPIAIREAQAVMAKEGESLNKHVGGAAMVEFFFCILVLVAKLVDP